METATGIRIDLPLLDYSRRRDTVLKECYITLYDTYACYKTVSTHDALNDDTELWEYKNSNYRWTIKKSNISGVDMYFDNTEKLWCVSLHFSGIDSNGWLFDDPKKALAVYTQLSDYIIGTEH